MVEAGEAESTTSYGQLMRTVGGRPAAQFTQGLQALGNLGTLIAYTMLIGDFLEAIGHTIWPNEGIKRMNWQLGVCLIIILPLVLKRHLNGLRVTSFLSIIFVLVFAMSVMIRSGELLEEHGTGPGVKAALGGGNLFRTMPVAVFAYTCHTSVLPIYNEMRSRTLADFKEVAKNAYLICGGLYILVGLFGYLTFGSSLSGNALSAYKTPFIASVVTALFMFTIVFTFPLVSFTARIGFHYVLFGKTESSNVVYYLEVLFIFSVAVTIGLFVKDVGIVFSLIGSISGSLLSIICPASVLLYSKNIQLSVRRKRALQALVLFGVFLMISGTLTSLLAVA